MTAIDSNSLTYDNKGNLTTNSNGHEYNWDFENQMTGANTDGNAGDDVTFQYDALYRVFVYTTENEMFEEALFIDTFEYPIRELCAKPDTKLSMGSKLHEQKQFPDWTRKLTANQR